MSKIIIILIIGLIIGLVIYIYFSFHHKSQNVIIGYSGVGGAGKTFNLTNDGIRFFKKSIRHWSKANKPDCFLDFIPGYKKKRLSSEYNGLDRPQLYSDYPIYINHKYKWSLPVTNDIMFERVSIPLGSQVVIDEFSSWISQFEFNEKFSDTLNDHIGKWRHYHGDDSHLLISDQCSKNIPIQVRYRLQEMYVAKKTVHLFKFIHITFYKLIDITDDIKNIEVVNDDNKDTNDKVCKLIRFQLFRHYDSRCLSNRYWYVDFNNANVKLSDSKFKSNDFIPKPNKNGVYPNLSDTINKYNSSKEVSVNEEVCFDSV